jgi:hypothetical protein
VSAASKASNCDRAGDRTRTGDVQLGKLAFYQLNYARDKDTTYRAEAFARRLVFLTNCGPRHRLASADMSADALVAPLICLFGSTQPGRTKWHV